MREREEREEEVLYLEFFLLLGFYTAREIRFDMILSIFEGRRLMEMDPTR